MNIKNTNILGLILLFFILAGCGRDISSVDKALLGHWVCVSENAHKGQEIYISENELTTVFTDGDVKSSNYSITRKNEKKNTIDIMTEDIASGFGMANYFEFTNQERTSVTRTYDTGNVNYGRGMSEREKQLLEGINVEITVEFEYLDNKQKPEE